LSRGHLKNRNEIFQAALRGGLQGTAIFLTSVLLAGCFTPIDRREAQNIAREKLTRYCKRQCGTLTMAGAQKIQRRWLVDFDTQRQKFTVIVELDGNSKVTAWNKDGTPPVPDYRPQTGSMTGSPKKNPWK
jgi:hypothetical protein